MRGPRAIGWSLLASLSTAQAQYLVSELSFGFGSRIAPENAQSIPNFSIQGNPNLPELLSDKLILTPPAPGNQRGGVWSDRPLMATTWVADVDFRVNGPERGSGNLNIWLVKDGAHDVGSSSVYTAGKFEGLVLVIDAHSGTAGMIRGFLNDGSKDYKTQQVNTLSFGHCEYSYRNLGRPSQIRFRQTESTFKVEINGHPCFESDAVALPTGYRLGITAASADNPDSFEIFKMVLMTEVPYQHDNTHGQQQQDAQEQPQYGEADRPPTKFARGGYNQQQPGTAADEQYEKDLPDEDASKIMTDKAQFADLHNRLQSTNHHLSSIFRQVSQLGVIGEKRHEEISVQVGELKGLLTKLDRIATVENKMDELAREMNSIHAELKQAINNAQQGIMYHVTGNLAGHHDSLSDRLKPAGHGRLIFVIVAGQVLLALSYVIYKRRKASSPKKYL